MEQTLLEKHFLINLKWRRKYISKENYRKEKVIWRGKEEKIKGGRWWEEEIRGNEEEVRRRVKERGREKKESWEGKKKIRRRKKESGGRN